MKELHNHKIKTFCISLNPRIINYRFMDLYFQSAAHHHNNFDFIGDNAYYFND